MMMDRSRSQIDLGLLLAAAVFLVGCGKNANRVAAQQAPPPVDVEVASAVERDVPLYGDWVASLDGYVNANIQPQVSGYLIRQNYREGSFVTEGQILFEIDPRPFQAVLDQAKGQLAQAKGQLAQARAQLGLAEINVKRDTPLAAAHAIPQSQLDNDIQAKAQAEALVQSNQAGIEAAQAAVETAELNLGFTKVRSLIDGIAGICTTQIGNLVSQTTVLTTVSQVNPIKVYFPISEQEYLTLTGKEARANGPNLLGSGSRVPLHLTLSNGNQYSSTGKIVFADRQVDPQTGTIRMVGAFSNPGNILRPGQFGRIRALTGRRRDAVLVPQRAVTEMQGRHLVAVVGPNNTVSIRAVEVAERIGGLWVIASGVKAGENVVTEGVMKIRDGARVNPKPDQDASKEVASVDNSLVHGAE